VTDPTFLSVQRQNGVLSIILARQPTNAFNLRMVEELMCALKEGAQDASIRCILLTGSGRAFSTGHDVGEIAGVRGVESYRDHLETTYNRIVMQMVRMDKPIVGAINGMAAGAGLGVALATDIRWAAQSARFLYGFTRIGLTADSGVSFLLPALVGLSRAMAFALMDEPLSAKEALSYGMITRLLPDDELQSAATELAASLASGPTRALGLTKRALYRPLIPALTQALAYEASLQEIASRTADHEEGLQAFLEKRPPNFEGK
jgi:2-(1,2-epoxy-1,2-dihydrophenyl)acetyl-CoA isomerase